MTHITGPRREKVAESLTPETIKRIEDAIAAVLSQDDALG